jgi:hypothetical protein
LESGTARIQENSNGTVISYPSSDFFYKITTLIANFIVVAFEMTVHMAGTEFPVKHIIMPSL